MAGNPDFMQYIVDLCFAMARRHTPGQASGDPFGGVTRSNETIVALYAH